MQIRTPNGAMPRLLSLTMAVAVALPATATLAQDSGWYVGAGAGASQADLETTDIAFSLRDGGFSPTTLDSDDGDTAFKLFGGYDFNEHFALEASWFSLGDFTYDATMFPSGTHHGKASVDGIALDLVGTLPFQGGLSAFARLGINNAKVDQEFVGSGLPFTFANRNDRGVHEKFGVGLQYRLSDAFSLRAELERYRLDGNRLIDDYADSFTASFVYRFGRSSPPPPVVAAPEPEPAPITTPTPPPPPPEPVEFTFSADALFDFDSAALRPAGQQELDGLLQEMEDMEVEVVVVTGHTDRIGTRAYNLDLSERRANSVRDYLVENGVPASRITARGVNGDDPVTSPGQCVNTGSAQAQIACLQPDRRVVVEVTGLREPE